MNYRMTFVARDEVEPGIVSAIHRAGHTYQDRYIESFLSEEAGWHSAFQRGLEQIQQFNVPLDMISIEIEE